MIDFSVHIINLLINIECFNTNLCDLLGNCVEKVPVNQLLVSCWLPGYLQASDRLLTGYQQFCKLNKTFAVE